MEEVPALNKLSAASRSDGLVLGVAVGDTTEKAQSVVTDKGMAYPSLVDPEFKLADAMGQRNVPFTMVLDREGRVVFTGGALDQAAVSAFERARATH
jgi:peroxiredoxin